MRNNKVGGGYSGRLGHKHIQYTLMSRRKVSKKKDYKAGLIALLSKPRQFYDKHPWITLLLLGLLAWGLIWASQVALERYNFFRVEKGMDRVSQEITNNFEVLSSKKERSCGKRSEAFGEHLGGCSITVRYFFETADNPTNFARRIDNKIKNIPGVKPKYFNNNGEHTLFSLTYKLRPDDPDKFYSNYYLNSIVNPSCEIDYVPKINNIHNKLELSFSCFLSGDAKFQYFPVRD